LVLGGVEEVFGGVDDGDGAARAAGLGVDGVDLVAAWVGGDAGRVLADLEGAVLTQVDEVEHGDGVGAAVGDVGELAVAFGHGGEAVAGAAGGGEQGQRGGGKRVFQSARKMARG